MMTNPTAYNSLPKSKLTNKPVLHFVHANGIVAASYEPILEILSRFFSIEKIDNLGTHPNYPVDNHWQNLTRQVGDSILDACHKHGVPNLVALGHSVGAVTTLQSLLADPKPISQAILLDPSILMGKNSFIYQMAKLADKSLNKAAILGDSFQHYFVDKLSPAAKSKYRKDVFSSPQQAYDSLRNKALFRSFDDRCFDLYIQHGLTKRSDGLYELTIAKSVELAIFRTIPSWYWYKSISPKRPVWFLVGNDSHFTKIGSYQALEKSGLEVIKMTGGHMFPLETPQQTAQKILDLFALS